MDENLLKQFALEGKTVLVTGASSGIGRQIAIHVAALGGKVVITGRDEQRLSETLSQLHGQGHISLKADLTVTDEIASLSRQVPALDGVVHSAGILSPYPAKFIGEHDIESAFNVNYKAPVLLMTALFKNKKINKNASIVFISSFSSHYPYATGALYTGSKAALENYAKVLAVENAGSGLRSNSILPSLVKTDMYEKTKEALSKTPEAVKKYENFYLRGIGETEDVANIVTFLLSNASKWITGQSFVVDGGYLLGLLTKMLQ
jgi:NAD(P)-dependent dehydrogenase (short-subunit alcohol dehydrogenase family)